MKLRASIVFPDDVADAVVTFDNAYRDADTARKWQAAVVHATPGSVAMELEQWCENCGRWESYDPCESCGFEFCTKEMDEGRKFLGRAICGECWDEYYTSNAPRGEREIARRLGVMREGVYGVR